MFIEEDNLRKLNIANNIRAAGFDSKVEMYPKVKKDLLSMLDKGYTFRRMHRTLVKNHGDAAPSLNAMISWIKKRSKTEVSIDTRTCRARKRTRFDPLLLHYDLLENSLKEYKKLNTLGATATTLLRYEIHILDIVRRTFKLEKEMGVIQALIKIHNEYTRTEHEHSQELEVEIDPSGITINEVKKQLEKLEYYRWINTSNRVVAK